jgi:DNA polymerase
MDELPGLGAAVNRARPSYVSATTDLEKLREAARACQGCHLYRDATQTVFGSGPATARVVMVGEQPATSRTGAACRSWVRPARCSIGHSRRPESNRSLVYVTNAVKHFKHKPAAAGKRRIHATPERLEITACRPWLIAEFAAIRPAGVAVLGATAAKALFGPSFRVTKSRGEVLPWPASAQHPEEFRRPRAARDSPSPRFTRLRPPRDDRMRP